LSRAKPAKFDSRLGIQRPYGPRLEADGRQRRRGFTEAPPPPRARGEGANLAFDTTMFADTRSTTINTAAALTVVLAERATPACLAHLAIAVVLTYCGAVALSALTANVVVLTEIAHFALGLWEVVFTHQRRLAVFAH